MVGGLCSRSVHHATPPSVLCPRCHPKYCLAPCSLHPHTPHRRSHARSAPTSAAAPFSQRPAPKPTRAAAPTVQRRMPSRRSSRAPWACVDCSRPPPRLPPPPRQPLLPSPGPAPQVLSLRHQRAAPPPVVPPRAAGPLVALLLVALPQVALLAVAALAASLVSLVSHRCRSPPSPRSLAWPPCLALGAVARSERAQAACKNGNKPMAPRTLRVAIMRILFFCEL